MNGYAEFMRLQKICENFGTLPFGMTLEVRSPDDYEMGYGLQIWSHMPAEDAYKVGFTTDVMSYVNIRDYYDEKEITGMIRKMLQSKLCHELDEGLLYKGDRLWNPHALVKV